MTDSPLRQFLFGYDDGHTLVAGSDILESGIRARLVRASDLAVGVNPTPSTAYWTGLPIDDDQYALMRTWAAPEMPRPGCVWSHVVLLDRRSLDDPSCLDRVRGRFVRPVDPGDMERYMTPLAALPDEGARPRDVIPARDAIDVLSAAYDPKARGIVRTDGDHHESVVFAIWKQQWSDLRAKFRFRTALYERPPTGAETEAWITFVRAQQPSNDTLTVPEWVLGLYKGLEPGSDLSSFLQRFGPELPATPGSVRLLARLSSFIGSPASGDRSAALGFVARELPDPAVGDELKVWVIDRVMENPTAKCSFDAARFAMADPRATALPQLHDRILTIVPRLWEDEPTTMFGILEARPPDLDEEGRLSIAELVASAPPEVLNRRPWTGRWDGREAAARSRRTLLDRLDWMLVPTDRVACFAQLLLATSEVDEKGWTTLLKTPLGDRLASVVDENSSSFAHAAVRTLARERDGSEIDDSWLKHLQRHEGLVVRLGVDLLASTASLAHVLGSLNWPEPRRNQPSTERLAEFWKRAEDDAQGEARFRMLAFTLHAAMRAADGGSEVLLEAAVPEIHEALRRGRLRWDLVDLVMSRVDQDLWTPPWDHCRRLRRAVRSFYKRCDLRQESWFRIKERIEELRESA